MKNEEKKIVKWTETIWNIIIPILVYWIAIGNLFRDSIALKLANIVLLILVTRATFREIKTWIRKRQNKGDLQ